MSIIKQNPNFTTNQPQANGRSANHPQTQSASSQVGSALKSSINRTIAQVGAFAVPPIIVGLIVTILLFICTWIIAQAISQLFGIHRHFLVICLAFLIGAILAGTARLVWGMSGVAIGIGSAIKNLLLNAEANNWDRQMVMSRLYLIGAVSALFIFITLFSISILGGVGFYITSQTTSNNIFAFNSDNMLKTDGSQVNQEELNNRSISIFPDMAAGKALKGINNAGLTASQAKSTEVATGGKHTVRKGDTLGKIAAKYNVTVQSLIYANKLYGSQINVGQKLTIPKQ